MSKPRERWWGYVKACIRAYPDLKSRAMELRQTPTTTRYGGPGSFGGPSDPVASAALRTLHPQEQRELEAVEAAIQETARLPDGETRLAIVDLVFWRQSHTLHGAADQVHLSYRSARRRQENFIRAVAKNMELTEKLAPKSQPSVVK